MKSAVTILLGTAVAGALLWPIPYSKVQLTAQGFQLPWLISGAVAAFATRLWFKQPAKTTALLIAAGYVAAVMGRVLVEGVADPYSHNLWPFEVVIGGGIGLLGGAIGALLGSLVGGRETKS